MSKLEQDYSKSVLLRKKAAEYLSSFDPDLVIKMIQPVNIREGILFEAYLNEDGKKIKIRFLNQVGGLFEKIPHDYLSDPSSYLDKRIAENTYLIVISKQVQFSSLISYADIKRDWDYKLAESPTNKNRLQYFGKASEIICRDPDEGDLMTASLIDQLKANLAEV